MTNHTKRQGIKAYRRRSKARQDEAALQDYLDWKHGVRPAWNVPATNDRQQMLVGLLPSWAHGVRVETTPKLWGRKRHILEATENRGH